MPVYSHSSPHQHSHPFQRPRIYHYSRRSGLGLGLGLLCLSLPLLAILGYLNYLTSPLTYYSITAASTSAFSLAGILGIGTLILYGCIGLAYLYSGAKECFDTDKNPIALLKSRILNKDGLSFYGVVNSISSVLWSPFLLLGGLSGMLVKIIVNKINKKEPSINKKLVDLVMEKSRRELDQRLQQLQKSIQTPSQQVVTFDVSQLPAPPVQPLIPVQPQTIDPSTLAPLIYPPLFGETTPPPKLYPDDSFRTSQQYRQGRY